MSSFRDHPQRYAMANELHARPFPQVAVPGYAIYLALKPEQNAAARDRERDRAHLLALLDRFGAAHPAPGATHHFGQIGRNRLKWESHTEFVTYTAFVPDMPERPFDPALFDVFPADWLAGATGVRVTSAILRVGAMPRGTAEVEARLAEWFVPESLACSSVLDGAAVVASDFRIDAAGHVRIAVFAAPGTGPQRIGRIVQRLCEIETYKSMSMLGFARARMLAAQMGALDGRLSALVGEMTAGAGRPDETLRKLLAVSAELEGLVTQSSFRFGATGAYEAIVHQRIDVLREERLSGRQTFAEFMMRRYDPAMRTVKSAERQLRGLSDRAMRAGTLLSTRVDVERSGQNQKLLESMDRRSDLQLRLQHTVEGLSVVAISYYAVNLAASLAAPLAEAVGVAKPALTAAITLPVVALVWFFVRGIRKRLHQDDG